MKVPQKDPIANYGLSISHDFDSAITTAFLYGGHLTRADWKHPRSEYAEIQLPEIVALVKASQSLWAHPLLLPTILLTNNIERTQRFCRKDLEGRLVAVERDLGVTKAGRLLSRREERTKKHSWTFPELTEEMHSVMTEIILTSCVPAWQYQFSELVLKLVPLVKNRLEPQGIQQQEITNYSDTVHTLQTEAVLRAGDDLEEMANFLQSAADNNKIYLKQLESRMAIQLQVVRYPIQTRHCVAAYSTC